MCAEIVFVHIGATGADLRSACQRTFYLGHPLHAPLPKGSRYALVGVGITVIISIISIVSTVDIISIVS